MQPSGYKPWLGLNVDKWSSALAVTKVANPDPHYFCKPDPDPHHGKKLDPDTHQSQN
jgi:hypothetical protein